MRALLVLGVACSLTTATAAEAHPLDTAYLRIETQGASVAITFDLDLALAAQELGVEAGAVDGVLQARATELAGKLYRARAPISTEPCQWGQVRASRKGVTVTLADQVTCSPGPVRWDLSFGVRIATTFQILGKVIDDGGERVITIDKATTELTIARDATSFSGAIQGGLEAMGILPAGWKRGAPAALGLVLFAVVLLAGARGSLKQAREVGALIAGIVVGGLVGQAAVALPLAAVIVAAASAVVFRKLDNQRWAFAAIGGVLAGLTWHGPQPSAGYALGLSLGAVVVLVLLGSLLGLLQRATVPRWVVPAISLVAGSIGAIHVIASAG